MVQLHKTSYTNSCDKEFRGMHLQFLKSKDILFRYILRRQVPAVRR